jgi:[ribosomal protein S5]-alanine N-acetyltransferase
LTHWIRSRRSIAVHLISPSLPCLERLVAGDLPAAEMESGLVFPGGTWPDDAEMREGLAVHLAACAQHPRDLQWRVFMIADEQNRVAGHAGFKGAPRRGGEVEIYWCVEPPWRGRAIAKAAAASLCAHAFASGAVTAITATIARQNIASQHVAAALGMHSVGRELKHGLPLWRLTRDEWRPPALSLSDSMPVIARALAAPR